MTVLMAQSNVHLSGMEELVWFEYRVIAKKTFFLFLILGPAGTA